MAELYATSCVFLSTIEQSGENSRGWVQLFKFAHSTKLDTQCIYKCTSCYSSLGTTVIIAGPAAEYEASPTLVLAHKDKCNAVNAAWANDITMYLSVFPEWLYFRFLRNII